MTKSDTRTAAGILRSAITRLSGPLGAVDRGHNWTPTLQRSMASWFAEMLRSLEAGQDISGEYVKIARELDMSGVTEGPLFEFCLNTQLGLMDALGSGRAGGESPGGVVEPPQ